MGHPNAHWQGPRRPLQWEQCFKPSDAKPLVPPTALKTFAPADATWRPVIVSAIRSRSEKEPNVSISCSDAKCEN